jgi:hypothetical protein
MNDAEMGFQPMIHDNMRGGLQTPPGPECRALSAGKNVSKRHGNACEQHGMQDTQSIVSSVDGLDGKAMEGC